MCRLAEEAMTNKGDKRPNMSLDGFEYNFPCYYYDSDHWPPASSSPNGSHTLTPDGSLNCNGLDRVELGKTLPVIETNSSEPLRSLEVVKWA